MKKILILFYLITTSSSLLSQNFFLKLGSNFSTQEYFGFGEDLKQELLLGLQFGSGVEFLLSENLVFSPELHIISKGTKYERAIPIFNEIVQTRSKIWYVVPSLLFKYSWDTKKEEMGYYIKLGPYGGYDFYSKIHNLTTRSVVDGNGDLITQSSERELAEFNSSFNFSLLDYGLEAALGLDYNKLFIEIGYSYSLVTIGRDQAFAIINKTAYLNFGYYFNRKNKSDDDIKK